MMLDNEKVYGATYNKNGVGLYCTVQPQGFTYYWSEGMIVIP
jgi:hypothetical protein